MNKKTLLILIPFFLFNLIIAALFYIYTSGGIKSTAPFAELAALGDVDALDIQHKGQIITLQRVGNGEEQTWFAHTIQGNTRVNPKQAQKVIDLLSALSHVKIDSSALLRYEEAAQYGCDNPRLKLVVSWHKPHPGRLTFAFGQGEFSGQRVYLALSELKRFTLVSNQILRYFDTAGFDLLIDRRITTFDTDAIESITTTGKCRNIDLVRDGDHWVVNKGALSAGVIDDYLDGLTNIQYEKSLPTPGTLPKPWCQISLQGRHNRRESLRISLLPQDSAHFALTGSALSGSFLIGHSQLSLLAP